MSNEYCVMCGGYHPSVTNGCTKTVVNFQPFESVSPAPQPTSNLLHVNGGTCYAHGPFSGSICAKWPACATDPQIYKPVAAPQEVTLYDYKLDKGLGGITRPVKVVLHSDYVSLSEEHDKMMQLMARLVEQWDEESAEAVRKAVKP